MEVKIKTEHSQDIKADLVSFNISISSYNKDVVASTKTVYELYTKIQENFRANGLENIFMSRVFTQKHLVREQKEEFPAFFDTKKIVKTSTEYVYDGFDSSGYIRGEIKLDKVNLEFLHSIYNVLSLNDDKNIVKLDYSFDYSKELIDNTMRDIRKELINKSVSILGDLYKEADDMSLEEIRYGYKDDYNSNNYGMVKASRMNMVSSDENDDIECTADLAQFLITKENAPIRTIFDSIETVWEV